jgi:DNA excision repair protein ERCC-5
LANAVYQEDIDGSPVRPKRTPRQDDKGKGKSQPSPASTEDPDSTKKKNKWHDHDPYRLPELDFGAAVAKATSSTAPDPRLATEDELRNFIEEMVPEDFDIGSEAFRSLPTEVQYEIIGDLRLKSRQTSHMRLQHMLATAPTALDFSKAQIVNLKQRNALTQQLLATTETVGKVKRSTMPVRIAGERNRQYVLVRNTTGDGGWVLGVRDEGTRAKPIDVDKHSGNDSEDSDDDADMEEIVPMQ